MAPQMGEKQRERWDAVREAYKSFDFLDRIKICNRTAYAESLASGMGLFEMARPDLKAKRGVAGPLSRGVRAGLDEGLETG